MVVAVGLTCLVPVAWTVPSELIVTVSAFSTDQLSVEALPEVIDAGSAVKRTTRGAVPWVTWTVTTAGDRAARIASGQGIRGGLRWAETTRVPFTSHVADSADLDRLRVGCGVEDRGAFAGQDRSSAKPSKP